MYPSTTQDLIKRIASFDWVYRVLREMWQWATGTRMKFVGFGTTPGEYRAPTATDHRSPCPALNTLANHGFLPRDGRNITRGMLQDAINNVLGLGVLPVTIVNTAAFGTKHPGVRTHTQVLQGSGVEYLDLKDLNQHGRIEHDASLSRKDAHLGSNHLPDKHLVEEFKKASKDGKYVTLDDLIAYRAKRVADSKINNPTADLGEFCMKLSHTESTLALYVLGRNGRISVDEIDSFFYQERLPNGWKKADHIIGIFEFKKYVDQVKTRTAEAEKSK